MKLSTDPTEALAALDENGYFIVESVLSLDEVARIRRSLEPALKETAFGHTDFDGYYTRRLYALFAKTRQLDRLALDPLVLSVLDAVLGHYQLASPTAIEVGPGEIAQILHTDDGLYPLPMDYPDVIVQAAWALDKFTVANGATRLLPGSHRLGRRKPPEADLERMVHAVMPAGSLLITLGTLWHGAGSNATATPRLGVFLEYAASWLRTQENLILGVPREVIIDLPERLQELLGYNIYPPVIGHVDGRHPRVALQD